MAQRELSRELVTRPIDEEPCYWCGRTLTVGTVAYYDKDNGSAYCSADCRSEEHRRIPIKIRRPRNDKAA